MINIDENGNITGMHRSAAVLHNMETGALQLLLNEYLKKVEIAGDMVEKAKIAFNTSETQEAAARNDRHLKNCRKHLKECRMTRTLIQSILIDRSTTEALQTKYNNMGEYKNE